MQATKAKGGAQILKKRVQSKRPPATPLQAARRASTLDTAMHPEMFRALSDVTRLRLLVCLAKCARSCSVSEIGECCDVDLSVVSRHLTLLQEAGIVGQERQGRNRLYHVRFEHVSRVFRALAAEFDACAAAGGGVCCEKGCCE